MLTPAELSRYNRHTQLLGVGGQEKLKAGRVLLIGAGGLGSPAALYLAAAGVGTIGLVDFDVVDESNLQRQVIYSTSSVGKSKVAEAKARLEALNPHIEIVAHEQRLGVDAIELFSNYDVVIDGSDNFPTRYLANDAAFLAGVPLVYGSIIQYEGQVSVFGVGPCYRCLYPTPPAPGTVPNCAEGGVLGVLPGVIGTLQATEAIKLILGIGKPLVGRLLLYDALELEFETIRIKKNSNCPLCGDNPTIRGLIDYEAFCAVGMQEITVIEFATLRKHNPDVVLLDVREADERKICVIPGAIHIPLAEVEKRVAELPANRDVIVHCKLGGRSATATQILQSKGIRATNLRGGILAYIAEVDSSLTKY